MDTPTYLLQASTKQELNDVDELVFHFLHSNFHIASGIDVEKEKMTPVACLMFPFDGQNQSIKFYLTAGRGEKGYAVTGWWDDCAGELIIQDQHLPRNWIQVKLQNLCQTHQRTIEDITGREFKKILLDRGWPVLGGQTFNVPREIRVYLRKGVWFDGIKVHEVRINKMNEVSLIQRPKENAPRIPGTFLVVTTSLEALKKYSVIDTKQGGTLLPHMHTPYK